MVLLEILQVLAIFLISIFFLFQIIIPIWKGTELFPSFHSKTRMLDKEMRKARSEREILEEEEEELQKFKASNQKEKKENETKGPSDGI